MADYAEHWKRYKCTNILSLLLFIGYVPAIAVAGYICKKLVNTPTPGFMLAFPWMILLVINANRALNWRCPRCGERFGDRWNRTLADRCGHCGLAKYQNSEK